MGGGACRGMTGGETRMDLQRTEALQTLLAADRHWAWRVEAGGGANKKRREHAHLLGSTRLTVGRAVVNRRGKAEGIGGARAK